MSEINIKQVHKQVFEGFNDSELILQFIGKNVSNILVNTLRRLSLDYVPRYSFCPDTIFIEKNTSIAFNNDYMRLHISQYPLKNINHNIAYLPRKYWKNIKYNSEDRPKHSNDNYNIEMYVNVENNTSEIINVTTNHAEFYNDGNSITNLFDKKYPTLIIQLKPGDEFIYRAKAVLGIGLTDAIWSSASNCYFDGECDENKKNGNYIFTIKSCGQLDEYDILRRSCIVLKEKLKEIKYIVGNRFKKAVRSEYDYMEIALDGESETICAILIDTLQNNSNIEFAGMKRDILKDLSILKLIPKKKNDITSFFESITYLTKMFTELEKKFIKMSKLKPM